MRNNRREQRNSATSGMIQLGPSKDDGPDVYGSAMGEQAPASTETGLGISVDGGGARSLGQAGAVLSRKHRLQVFGIDCTGPFGDGILFRGGEWAPGGEYVQRLRVKNVSPKLKKLKYRLPTTKYFSLAYPEVITLSPGTMQEVDVVFRPMSSEVHDDVILFKVLDGPNAGGFNVPVRALLPTLQVGIPEGLDFGYCQADDVSERTFFVQNMGEVPAPFVWEVPPPFMMTPSEGIVAVGESKAVTCSIRPVDASVFVSQAALRVGQGINAIKPKPLLEMKVSAVGKYCYVVPSEDEVDFGDQTIVAAGAPSGGDRGDGARKEFTLRNQSVVPAAFTIRRLEQDRDAVFAVRPSEGVIPPEDEMLVTATYSPVSAGTFSRDHYEITTTGGNKVTVGIQGRAVGCSVRLEKKEDPFARGCGVTDSVNFREVKVGLTTTRVLYLYNKSSSACRFCFAIQGDNSVFRFSHTRGSIPCAGSEHPGEAQVTLTFTPTKPTNYYRRIFCLLENQQPVVLDVMGTAYVVAKGEVQEQRPAPLRHAHVQAFRNRENVGLGRCSQEELEPLLNEEGMSDLFAKVGPQGTLPLQHCSVERPLTRSGEATRVQTAAAAEFFVDPTDRLSNVVCLDRSIVDFGFSSGGGEETVVLTNSSNTEVHVVWNLQPSEGGESGGAGLKITPLEADVPAGGSLPFRVAVFPTKGNCYLAEEAEAFVSPANQMTFRTVKDATQQPPWCLPLRVLGHTFVGEQFLAKASLSTQHTGQRLYFPACHVGDTVYQTIRLLNQGNIPACFSFQPDPTGVFDVKPAVGLVPAGDFQLCLARFTPPGVGGRRHRLVCVLNNDPGSTQEAELLGQGAVPAIEATSDGWEGDSDRELSLGGSLGSGLEAEMERDARRVVYMRPTCVGIVSSGTFKVKNLSRIPVIFAVEPPKASSGVLRVSPLAGLLLGNQTATLQIAFAPRDTKLYRFRLPIKVRSILGETPHLTDCRQLGQAMPAAIGLGAHVIIVGQGERGAVTFHPQALNYSVRLVNTPESKALVLENCSECDVTYKLFYIAKQEPPTRRSSREPTGVESKEGSKTRDLRPVPKENGEAKGQGGANTTDGLFVDRPEGILPARSRTRTIVTFRPVCEGEYGYDILCQVSVGGIGDDIAPSPIHADMVEQGNKARASAAMLGGPTVPPATDTGIGDGGADRGSIGAEKGMMPLQCSISGRASFPTVVFRDVRMTRPDGGDILGSSPRNLWSALSLTTINDMLSKPLSNEEVRFNQASSPDTSRLPRFDVPFVPSVIGSGPVVITLQVCNPGFLPTAVTVNLPNAKPVEMETWANQGEPTAEELRQNEIIDRLKAFSLTPDPGTVIEVSPGKTRSLRIAYSANCLLYGGVHDLPVLVSIKEGRHFWLDLKGTTVPPESPMLYAPVGLGGEYVLEPVAIGTPLAEAPLQTTELLNVGKAMASYRVEGHGIKRANNSQGYGMPIFRLENKTGTIRGGGSARLRWRFLPLEAKEYVLRVTVRTEEKYDERFGEQPDEKSVTITLRAVGYDPRERDPHSEILPPVDLGLIHPPRQLEIPRGQPCVLGAERLRLGRIPQGAILSRVLSIRNCLLSTAVEFSWDPLDTGLDSPLLSSGVVSIHPLKGRLDASQSLLLRVTISAECGPRFLGQQSVACLVRQVPPTTASRSRKAKSRLESRMEEERQTRARAPEPRVPVVSRPTAARTQHMAETAKSLSTRNSSDSNGRVLCPRYPLSTLNAPVPRVLAEAIEGGTRRGDYAREGETPTYSKGGNHDGSNSGGDGGVQQGSGGGGIGLSQNLSITNSGRNTETFSPGGGGPPTVRGGSSILRVDVEAEVVCVETYNKLFGGRGDSHRPSKRSLGRDTEIPDNGGESKAARIDAFLVPHPSSYVADWAAFGAGGWNKNKNDRHDRVSSTPSATEKGEYDQLLLKRTSQDALAGDVTNRVLKRFMGDVMAAHEVRTCLETLPSQARVPTFREVQNTLSLPERVVQKLAPHLQGLLDRSTAPPPPLTAAAAAIGVSTLKSGDRPTLNCHTLLNKEALVPALRALETAGASAGRGKPGKNCESAQGPQKMRPLAALLSAAEAAPREGVTVLGLLSTLDNTAIGSIESWLQRTELEQKNLASATVAPAPGIAGNGKTGCATEDCHRPPQASTTVVESQESKMATTIQSQARRRQGVQAAEAAVEQRRLRLAGKACQDRETQRTVASALQGTLFNLMQEAFNGDFNLSKRPTRFAIKKPSATGPEASVGAKGVAKKESPLRGGMERQTAVPSALGIAPETSGSDEAEGIIAAVTAVPSY